MSELEVLSGTIEGVLFKKPDTGFVILRVRPEATEDGKDGRADAKGGVTVVGALLDPAPGTLVRAEGRFEVDRAYGRQFRASRLTAVPPPDHVAVAGFLASGVVKGMRGRTAQKLSDHFGEGIAEVIERDHKRLAEVKGVGATLAKRIHSSWTAEKGTREVMFFLHAAGVSPARAKRILEAYGGAAIGKVLADPYMLVRDIRGIGFETADNLAERLNIPKDAAVRRTAALFEALRRAGDEGHSAQPYDEVVAAAARQLGVETGLIEAAVDEALTSRRLARVKVGGERYLMLQELRNAERRIAERLQALMAKPPVWTEMSPDALMRPAEAKLDIALATSQRGALAVALSSKVSIITGGPGTGKTTLVKALVAALEDKVERIRLAAPTGRAARRLAESTGRPAMTLHRLLEADPSRGFHRNYLNRLDADVLVVDEVSMVDLSLMAALLGALRDEAVVVLVGDADQLPPVGPGQALADMIESGVVPTARLVEVFRQAAQSDIVRNAHRVIRGLMPAFKGSETPDAFGIRAQDSEDAIDKVIDLVTRRIPDHFGIVSDQIQVLTPVNKGPSGTRTLNARLQDALNPEPFAAIEHRGQRLGTGDKVMQTENDYQREIYNGDIGRVLAVSTASRRLEVMFEERSVVAEKEALDSLVPAYAITVHKAQGSEYPAVIVVLAREHGRMLKRRLLYTAMTRAQRLLVIVAADEALERAVAVREPVRRSLLRHEINLAFDLDFDAGGDPTDRDEEEAHGRALAPG